MQQTVITRAIKSKQIVMGFDRADIDPVASKLEGKTIYFQPKAGEYLISDEDADYLKGRILAAPRNSVIDRAGKFIGRLELMTEEEKETEKKGLLQIVLHKAAQMKAELEIKGDVEALEKSQQWYSEEVSKIKLSYGG